MKNYKQARDIWKEMTWMKGIYNSPHFHQDAYRDDDMLWTTSTGEKMMASTMSTSHLFNALRLMFNRVVPPEYQLECPSKSRVCVDNNDNRRALKILFKLVTADSRVTEMTDEMDECLLHMAIVFRKMNF